MITLSNFQNHFKITPFVKSTHGNLMKLKKSNAFGIQSVLDNHLTFRAKVKGRAVI